jgi:hypothetical protein
MEGRQRPGALLKVRALRVHRGHEPVSMIVPADSENQFLQVSGLQSDDKTLMQVKQSFASCSTASVHGK